MGLFVDSLKVLLHAFLGPDCLFVLQIKLVVLSQQVLVHALLLVHELVFGHSGLVSQVFELAFVLFLLLLRRLMLLVEIVLQDFVRLLGAL